MHPKDAEELRKTRQCIIESIATETGSMQYAEEKEFASWSELVWATAATHTHENPKRLAVKLNKAIIDPDESGK